MTLRHRIKGDEWSKDTTAVRVDVASRGATTRYRLDASSLLPFDEIEIVCADESFSRRVRLSEEVVAAGRKSERLLGDGSVFRMRGRNAQGEGESTRLRVRNGSGGDLLLDIDIDDGSSEALRDLKVRLHGSRVRLVFPLGVSTRELWLYYGNRATRAPAYDIESLRPRLIQALGATVATLGEELNNPRFKPEPPLRFAAVLGAPLQASQWRRERLLVPIPEEDVYALNLTAGDLGALRADLADLRVVSENDLQVPFLIDRDFALERLAFKVVREAGALPHQSRYQLTPALAGEGGDAPRVFRIEIEIADAFFERPARLLHAGQKARENEFSSITLVRRPPSSAPQVLDLDAPLGPLSLEIDDGDNAALDVHSAAGFVRVPRIVFKSPPGNLRLLLGNRAAEPPRYDLASLRSELLAYSAVTATAGVPRENKGSRETLVSRLRGAPQSAIVWGAIIISVAALIGLTLRTLKKT